MIIKAEVINQPYSGEYNERIYDISSPWNSQSWAWIKFTNEDLTEWCGNFRGFPRDVAVSKKYNSVLVLTSDYLFKLDCLEFANLFLVSCPNCSGCAEVFIPNNAKGYDGVHTWGITSRRLVCKSCGLIKEVHPQRGPHNDWKFDYELYTKKGPVDGILTKEK